MDNFFSLIGERIRLYPQIKIGKTVEVFLNKPVLMRLGLTNMNALRDRYEGQSFLDKHRSRLFSNLAIREYQGEIVRSRSFKLIDEDENIVNIKGQSYSIQVCQFGEMPLFKNIDNFKRPVILVYQRDIYWIHILGIISIENASEPSNYSKRGNYFEYQAFNNLTKL